MNEYARHAHTPAALLRPWPPPTLLSQLFVNGQNLSHLILIVVVVIIYIYTFHIRKEIRENYSYI